MRATCGSRSASQRRAGGTNPESARSHVLESRIGGRGFSDDSVAGCQDKPLTLGELIDLIDTSARDDEAYPGGLVNSHLEYLLHEEAWIETPAEVAFFATVTSAFYPMLNEYYLARAEAWLAEVEAERQAEREEEEYELIAIKRGDIDEAIRLAKTIGAA